MAQRITRREFARRAAATAAAASLGGLAAAQQTPKPDEGTHPAIPLLNKRLSKPVPAELQKQLSDALKNLDSLSAARSKHKLPEGSEPSTLFFSTRAPERKR